MPSPRQKPSRTYAINPLHRLFFLYIEPISALVGAHYALLHPDQYLSLTDAASAPLTPNTVPIATHIVLQQLGNLYLLFALNEGLVLRCTNDRKVWSTLLVGLLIADVGHLVSVKALGWGIYVRFWEWNAMHWGNLGFVYLGALMRISFLMGY